MIYEVTEQQFWLLVGADAPFFWEETLDEIKLFLQKPGWVLISSHAKPPEVTPEEMLVDDGQGGEPFRQDVQQFLIWKQERLKRAGAIHVISAKLASVEFKLVTD